MNVNPVMTVSPEPAGALFVALSGAAPGCEEAWRTVKVKLKIRSSSEDSRSKNDGVVGDVLISGSCISSLYQHGALNALVGLVAPTCTYSTKLSSPRSFLAAYRVAGKVLGVILSRVRLREVVT